MPPTLPNISRASAAGSSGTATSLNLDIKNLDVVSLTADQATIGELKINDPLTTFKVSSLEVVNDSNPAIPAQVTLKSGGWTTEITGDLVVKEKVTDRIFLNTFTSSGFGTNFFIRDTTKETVPPFFSATSANASITLSNPLLYGKAGYPGPFLSMNAMTEQMYFAYTGTARRHARASSDFFKVDSQTGMVHVDDLAVNNHLEAYSATVGTLSTTSEFTAPTLTTSVLKNPGNTVQLNLNDTGLVIGGTTTMDNLTVTGTLNLSPTLTTDTLTANVAVITPKLQNTSGTVQHRMTTTRHVFTGPMDFPNILQTHTISTGETYMEMAPATARLNLYSIPSTQLFARFDNKLSQFTVYKTGGAAPLFSVDQPSHTISMDAAATLTLPNTVKASTLTNASGTVSIALGTTDTTVTGPLSTSGTVTAPAVVTTTSLTTPLLKNAGNTVSLQLDPTKGVFTGALEFPSAGKTFLSIDPATSRATFLTPPTAKEFVRIDSATPKFLVFKSDGTTPMMTIDPLTNAITVDPSVTFTAPITASSPGMMGLKLVNYLNVPINGHTPIGGSCLGIDTLQDVSSTVVSTYYIRNDLMGLAYDGPNSKFTLVNPTRTRMYLVTGACYVGVSNFIWSGIEIRIGGTVVYRVGNEAIYSWPENQNVPGGTYDATTSVSFSHQIRLSTATPDFQIVVFSNDPAETAALIQCNVCISEIR